MSDAGCQTHAQARTGASDQAAIGGGSSHLLKLGMTIENLDFYLCF